MEEGRRRVKLPSRSTTMVKPTFKKVQVVYYLSKNGQLEHPHIVEVTHLVHHHLRLKDVLERLSVLRGSGMPSLYSWSCKRMYKNGYVWHDIGENDIICPSEGEEYVLKASQLVHHSPDKQVQVSETQMVLSKRKQITPKRHTKFNEEDLDLEEKRLINYTNNTPSRYSRDTKLEILPKPTIDATLSPPPSLSTTSGDENNSISNKLDLGDPPYNPPPSRNSVLLHLMACGGSMSMGFKGKSDDDHHQPPYVAARKSSSSSSLRKGVVCKAAATVAVEEDEICYMSENPRFGISTAEEREYFSGSIVETMNEKRVQVEPMLNKSSSYKEERMSKAAVEEEEMKREKEMAVKCIPNRFCS